MLLMIAVLCTLGLPSTSNAQQPCETPKQWEADLNVVNVMMRTTMYLKITYDAINQRERTNGSVGVAAEHFIQDTLTLWKERKRYEYNYFTKECDVTDLSGPFQPRGVPSNGKFQDNTSVGAKGLMGEYFNTNTFYGNASDGTYLWTVTTPSCIPVQYTHYTSDQGVETDNYYNVRLGIPKDADWDIPKQCIK